MKTFETRYRVCKLLEKLVVVDWASERPFGRHLEVILCKDEEVQVMEYKVLNGTVFTVFWTSSTGALFSISRFVRDDGKLFHNYMSREMHARIVRDMVPVI